MVPLPRRGARLDELRRSLIPLQARLGRLLWRGQENPDPKAAALCRELTKWWPAVWIFARVEGVEPMNNVAERLLTLVACCHQQARSLLAFLVAAGEAAARGSPLLLPLPAFSPAA